MYNYNSSRGDYLDSQHRQAVGGWALMSEMSKIKKDVKKITEEKKEDDKNSTSV